MVLDKESCVRHLESRSLKPDDTIALLCVGSTARGWANDASDVDIYVITKVAPELPGALDMAVALSPPVVPALTDHFDGRRWEIKYWTDGQVDQILSKIDRSRPDSGALEGPLPEKEELFIERLLSALPITGADWLARRQSQAVASTYRDDVVSRSLHKADGSVEDALGQLAGDDLVSAVLSAHDAMQHTVDALLESVGCFGSLTRKWRARRMREAAPALLSFDEYWGMETMDGLDRADPREWVLRITTWCKRTAAEIAVA
jgi:Nucleotidyltransferase domain